MRCAVVIGLQPAGALSHNGAGGTRTLVAKGRYGELLEEARAAQASSLPARCDVATAHSMIVSHSCGRLFTV
jgi:hypothetical protein